MAKTYNSTIKFTGQFDTKQITQGLQDIKKQVTNANISDELKKQFESAFNKLQVNIPALEKLTSKEDFNLKDIEALQKLLKEVTKDWENLNKVTDQIDLSKTFSAKDVEKINNLDKQIKQTEDNIKKARKELVDAFSSEAKISVSNKNVSDALTELFTVNPNEIDNKFKEIQAQFAEGVQQTQFELENKLKGANIQKTGTQILDYFFGKDSGVEFAGKIGPIRDQINEIIRAYRGFKEANDEAKMAEQIQKLNQVLTDTANFKFPEGYQLFGLPTQQDLQTIDAIGSALKKLKELAEGKEVFFTEEETKAAELMRQKLEAEAQAARNANQDNNNLKNSLKGVGDTLKDTGDKAGDLADTFNKAKAQSDALSATFGSLANRITNSISALTVFNKSIQIIHKAIDSVKELDAAFTQIAIVSEKTNEEAWQMFDSFNKLAKQYSITTKDLTEGAKLFYQQGLNEADTMKMVEASTISAALGEVSMAEAANTLTAAIQGYNESASVALDYTDKIAMVGAVSAADFNELSVAMEKTASSAYTAGIDFDHLLGYLGKMIEVTREAPANLGTAMKTIIARFEDMKKDPMAILEDGVSANKVEAALATIGIALRNSEGEFRALQDVMDELGGKWNSLTRNQQAYIATVAAGSRQQSRFLALMNNYNRTMELVAESQNSAGAAARQYATYQDSAAAASARLTAAWEEFYSKIANPETITNVINLLTKLVEVMNKIGPAGSAAIAVFGAHTINKVIKGDWLSKIINSSLIGDKVKNEAGKKLTLTIKSVFENGIELGVNQALGKFTESNFSDYQEALIKAGQIGTEKGILQGIGKAGTGIGSVLPGIISSLGKVLSVVGIITTFLAVAAGSILLMSKLNESLIKQKENELKKQSEIAKEIREQQEEFKKQKNSIKDNLNIYEEYENKIVLTEEEIQEQNEAIDKLKENNNKLIISVDELGRKHIANKEILKDQVETLEIQEKLVDSIIAKQKLKAIEVPKDNLQDLTVEQLVNSGYTQDEAQIIDNYGNLFKTHQLEGSAFSWLIGNRPGQDLGSEIKKEMKENKLKPEDFGFDPYTISAILQSGQLKAIEDLLSRLKNSLSLSEDESVNNVLSFIIEKAEQAQQGLTLLNEKAYECAKALLNINFDTNDNIAQNDFANLFNNLDLFGNGEYVKQFENKTADDIEKLTNDIIKNIEEEWEDMGAAGQKAFHDLSTKLLDPNISSNDKDKAVKEFEDAYGEIEGELQKIINQYIEGSNIDINRRKKLSEKLGPVITEKDLRDYSSSQLKIIDQLRISNKNEGFDFGAYIKTDTGKQMLTLLSSLEKDIADNPTIYGKAQDIMKKFFMDNFSLDEVDAFNTFQSIFGNIPEAAVEAAQDTFENAKSLVLTEPDKALTKKQSEAYRELESLLGENLDYYISINDQGEKYLSIAGRIAVFDEASIRYKNSLIAETDDYITQIEQIRAVSKKNNEEISDQQAKQIKNLERNIELNNERIKKLEEIRKYNAQITAETANIDRADTYQSNLSDIKKAEDEMKKFNGRMNSDTAKSIIQMNSEYVQYLDKRLVGEDYYYTITAENIELLKRKERERYNNWIEDQKRTLQTQIDGLEAELAYYTAVVEAEGDLSKVVSDQSWENHEESTEKILEDYENTLGEKVEGEEQTNEEILKGALDTAKKFEQTWHVAYSNMESEWNNLAIAMKAGEPTTGKAAKLEYPNFEAENLNKAKLDKDNQETPNNPTEEQKPLSENEQHKQRAEEQITRINAALERLRAARDSLVPLGPELEDTSKSGGKADDSMKKLTDTLEDLADALEDLDNLLKDVKKDLKDITVDYNPFTDLFEAWEKEWDYYYNIKRLLQQIDTQGQYIDNIISADYVSADRRIEAEQAKVGNLLAKMAANDTYIEALRAGMSQTAVELMKDYGEYYKVDPTTSQLYQTDKNLNDINELMNERKEEIYNLQKLQNEKENDLALENAKLDALEKEKSAYEDILSTVESQLDKLKDNEDITADISGLQSQQTELKAKIEITDDSIEAQKDKIRDMEDEIQEIEVDITLKDQDFQQLEDYVSDMEDKVSEYEEYWENLNSTIAEQQELLSNLNEILKGYIDTAISTQQELYDAIVENYQNEINQKKKEYDYLKKLDDDYLRSIKDNINKERQAREDANKQKNYQQNVQRAQLLQMDTSGAYRNELASLNKEIENQRQDLYDDLVDKQVEAIEKEIEKRHELYDKEVEALEERLAYYQENAILLWEMVNSIVAEGTEAMMATLENTTEYINSNELAKDQQRQTWEYNVKKTFDGVQNHTIQTLESLVKAGNDFIINKYPEIGSALDDYRDVFIQASDAVDTYNNQLLTSSDMLNDKMEYATQVFQGILDSFMATWNQRTNEFTGYAKNWEEVTAALKKQTEDNLNNLRNLYDDQGRAISSAIGSIRNYDASLRQASAEIYNDFINERNRYRNELESLIKQIQNKISNAIGDAATAIRQAATSVSANPDNNDGSGKDSGGLGGNINGQYHASVSGTGQAEDGRNIGFNTTVGPFSSKTKAKAAAEEAFLEWCKRNGYIPRGKSINIYAKGGLADFTGPAWIDGTKSNPERILSPKQTKLFESMVSSLERTANNSNINSTFGSSYNIGDINTTIQVAKLDDNTDIDKVARQVENRIMKSIRNRVTVSIS